MIEANVNLWMHSRKELENMFITLQDQNKSRGVYITLEGTRAIPEDDGTLIEYIMDELSHTVRALSGSNAFNRPPLTEQEKHQQSEEFMAAEMGFDSVEAYLAHRKAASEAFMNSLIAHAKGLKEEENDS